MTPELIRLFIIIMLIAMLLWGLAVLVLGLRFGWPTRVPPPPLPRRRSKS